MKTLQQFPQEPEKIPDICRACPGVSLDMIRHVLKSLRDEVKVECLGRGPAAKWQKTSK